MSRNPTKMVIPIYTKVFVVVVVSMSKEQALYYGGEVDKKLGEVETTDLYWDCECKENYIHKKDEFYCFLCDNYASDQPDSRVNEVKAAGLPLE